MAAKESLLTSLLHSITHKIIRNPVWTFFITFIFAILGNYYTVLLYKNLRTDLEELLPSNARSVLDIQKVVHRLESVDNLAVLIFSQDTQGSKRFVDELAKELQKLPKNVIASVEYQIQKEIDFFNDRKALYLELDDILRIRQFIEDKINYEKKLYNPLNIFSEEELLEPQFNINKLKEKYASRVSSYSRFPKGYYATSDETKRVLLVYMPGKASGVDSMLRLKKAVENAIAVVNPAHFMNSKFEIRYTGNVQMTLEEHDAFIADLGISSVIVFIFVCAGVLLFFRNFLSTFALITSLLIGTFWTFGLSYFLVGYLNANSAFLGSIIIGNGINFGIILLARYLEERRNGVSPENSALTAIHKTALATLTAALAAGISYGSLALTGFRGFKQFGVIGIFGMILCWIAAYTALPAMLLIFEKFKPLIKQGSLNSKTENPFIAQAVAQFILKRAGFICLISTVLTVFSILLFTRFTPNIMETDLTKLRNQKSLKEGSGYLTKYVNEIFNRYLSPLVILADNNTEAIEISRRLKKIQSETPTSDIKSVQVIHDFLPTQQKEKIKLFEDIQKLLPLPIYSKLPPQEKDLLKEYLNPLVFTPIEKFSLPELILSKFREKDGSIGNLVLVEPPLENMTLDSVRLRKFIKLLRDTADSVRPGTPVAGSLPVSTDMFEAIVRDGPRATLIAFLAVLSLVVIIFRDFKTSFTILSSLILGMLWLFGFILGFQYKINFLNFIALPITFGIGVDYGVNIFSRFKQEGAESLFKVIRDTGGAVALCSYTTVIGYSSLLIAESGAFVSFGTLAVIGELTCLVAAIFTLPAFLVLLTKRKNVAKI